MAETKKIVITEAMPPKPASYNHLEVPRKARQLLLNALQQFRPGMLRFLLSLPDDNIGDDEVNMP